MRNFRFNPRGRAPIVTAVITGPRGTKRVRPIFDTGAERTQLHAQTMHKVGYNVSNAIAQASVVGAGGVETGGYVVSLEKLIVLGSKAETFKVGVYEMKHLNSRRLDGLLGCARIVSLTLRDLKYLKWKVKGYKLLHIFSQDSRGSCAKWARLYLGC